MTQAKATQFWTVETQEPVGQLGTVEQQKDLLDFLKNEDEGNRANEQKVAWAVPPPLEAIPPQQVSEKRGKNDDNWKSEPRIQALVAERILQLDAETRAKSLQGK